MSIEPDRRLPARRPRREDMRICRAILARGSKSFALASRLLPRRTREPATVVYAFCRVADDAVDLHPDPTAAVEALRARVHRVHAGAPIDDPIDRALCCVVQDHRMPARLFEALLEGFEWDACGRTYETPESLLEYCARVASAVGVIMTLIMGVRDRHVLARACDLGAAMQLTNVARDVGEDARRGRLYLPRSWMAEAGLDPDAWLAAPSFVPELGHVIRRVLAHANALYGRAHAGIGALPPDCRTAIRAAALIYADIGRAVRERGHDSVSGRAHVGAWRKLALVASLLWRRSSSDTRLHAPALPEAAFLLDAVEAA